MDFLLMLFTTWLLTSFTWGSPICDIKWEVDWNVKRQNFSWNQLFAQPGEFAPNITFPDLLNFTGTVWNTKSFHKINGLFCMRYAPYLNSLLEDDFLREGCDRVLASLREDKRMDMFGECSTVWDMVGVDEFAHNLIDPNNACASTSAKQLQFDLNITCDIDFLTIYADKIVERISPVVFGLLRWLGPSPFSGDVNGACSAVRILMSENIDNMVDELKSILRYPAADGLEYLAQDNVCEDLEDDIKQILDLISGSTYPNGGDICDFLSSGLSRDQYLQRAIDMIDVILSVPVEVSLCEGILAVVVEYYEDGSFYLITGSNLTVPSRRQTFCEQVTSSLSEDSPYIPTVYSLPDGQNFSISSLLNQPGEILPGFSFMDMIDLVEAFFRSETLSEGMVIFCTVFQDTLVQLDEDLNNLCTSLEAVDLASVERMCLSMLMPLQFNDRPVSFRTPTPVYMMVTGVDMARKLFGLTQISKDELCRAVDDFYHSANNPHSVVQLLLKSYLTELLPIADNICQDYDNVIDYLRSTSNQSMDFDHLSEDFSDLILTHLGFSDKKELCRLIEKGIDPTSGRPEDELVSTMSEELLLFMTDTNRCSRVMGKIESLMMTSFDDLSETIYSVTGYTDTAALCKAMSTAFIPGEVCANTEPRSVQCYSFMLMVVMTMMYYILFH